MLPFSADDFVRIRVQVGVDEALRSIDIADHGLPMIALAARGIEPFWVSWQNFVCKAIVDSSSGALSIKLLPSNQFSQEQIQVISETISRSRLFNPEVFLDKMLSSTLGGQPQLVPASDGLRSNPMKVILSLIWYTLLEKWHLSFTSILCDKLKAAFRTKLSVNAWAG